MTKIKLIAFDLMDTVILDPFYAQVPKKTNTPLETIGKAINRRTWPKFERGELSESEFFEQFYLPEWKQNPNLPSPKKIRDICLNSYSYISGIKKILSHLKNKGYELWALSNYPIWFETAQKVLQLDNYFTDYEVSYLTGYRKPEEAAYRHLLQRAGYNPQQCIFIDDREKNVKAATSIGIKGLLFTDVNTLKADLDVAL